MEFLAFILASVVLSRILEKRSRVGSVAFSILFAFLFVFRLMSSREFMNAMPFSDAYKESIAVFQNATNEVAGISAIQMIRLTMGLTISVTVVWSIILVAPAINHIITVGFTRHALKQFFTGELTHPSPVPMSNSVARFAPIAKTHTYLEFGVLRN